MPYPRFQPFSETHLITVLLGFSVVAVWIVCAKIFPKMERPLTRALAAVNLLAIPLAYPVWMNYPHTLGNLLPLHLCDLAAIIGGIALLTRKPLLLALTYFWGLAATLQALVTPAIPVGPPTAPFYHFFIQHFAVVAAALYIPLVLKWRPELPFWKTPLKIFVISLGYQLFTLAINPLLKTNFAFSLRPPRNPSLIDHLGPWPIYLITMQALALILFLLLALPFVRKRPFQETISPVGS